VWALPDARGNTFIAEYDSSGLVRRLAVDGKTVAEYSFDAASGRLRITRAGIVETVGLDTDGRVRDYSVEWADRRGASPAERLTMEYDETGRLLRTRGPGARVEERRYGTVASPDDPKELPLGEIRTLNTSVDPPAVEVRLSTPFGDERSLLTGDGRLLRVDDPSGVRGDFEYRGDGLSNATIRRGEFSTGLTVNDNRIRLFTRASGRSGPEEAAAVEMGREIDEAVWTLDSKGRLQEISLADGRRWVVGYEDLPKREDGSRRGGIRVTVTAK
jgi:hypothetical protein